MKGLARRVTLIAWVGVLLGTSTATAYAFEVTLCGRSSAETRRRARDLLRRWITRVDVLAHTSARCRSKRPGASVALAWLEARRSQVYLAVLFADGAVLRRRLPWRVSAGAALDDLAARGRIPQLTVMLQGLLVEHMVLRRLQRRRMRRGARARRLKRQRPPVQEHVGRARPRRIARREPSQPAASSPTTAKMSAPRPAAPTPSWSAEEPGLRLALDHRASRAKPRGARAAPSPAASKHRSASRPKRDKSAAPAASAGPSRRSLRVTTKRQATGWVRDLSLDASVAARWRDAGVWALQASADIGWRSLFVGVGYQVPATWSFEGRAVRVTSIPLRAGWRPTLWRSKHWRLAALAAVSLERLLLRRLDLPGAGTHGHWDAGVGGGLRFAVAVRGFEVAARAGLTWFPSGQRVEIPNGPITRFNRLTVLLALCVGYGGLR